MTATIAPEPTALAGRSFLVDLREVSETTGHSLVYEHLDELGAGDRLIVVSAYEPRVLQRRVGAWWRGCFDWAWLETGPGVWRARITRRA